MCELSAPHTNKSEPPRPDVQSRRSNELEDQRRELSAFENFESY
jgi:hypothetical protein